MATGPTAPAQAFTPSLTLSAPHAWRGTFALMVRALATALLTDGPVQVRLTMDSRLVAGGPPRLVVASRAYGTGTVTGLLTAFDPGLHHTGSLTVNGRTFDVEDIETIEV